ncbi:DUF4398 domain-containing protein [Marinicella sp. W31]|uniref:DUF4398 domain-containing protein n=1 Tax=Marinicella sp. W31 TaxID=3023713 RepID=UPI0037570DFD
MKKTSYILIITSLMLSLQAQAGRSEANKAVDQAKALIQSAIRSDARQLAAFELKSANDHLNTAEVKLTDKKWTSAEIAAKKAQRDAEVASAKAQALKSEQALNDLKIVVQSLKAELERTGEQQ